jgi:putative ABC transport system permease protein
MHTLHGLIPRNLATRKARTLLTVLGIALGVAAMVAAGVVRESATRSVADMFDQAAGRADLAVTTAMAGIVGNEGFDAVTLERVRAVSGVEMAAPLLQVATLPTTQLSDWKTSFMFGSFDGMVLYGVDPQASHAVGHYRLASGADLTAADRDVVLLSQRYAEDLDVGVGDQVELVAPTGQVRLTVVGLLASDGLARLGHGQVGLTTLSTAGRLFERPGRLDQIDVVAAPGTDAETLKTSLQTALGEGLRVLRPASKGALVDQMVQTIVIGLGFISVLALVVGAFLIYNTFATTVAERTHELGLLRAVGAGRGQIVRLVLVEAALLGLVGAALGVGLGLALATGMKTLVGAAINSELRALVILPEHVISGLVVGVAAALISGLAPALRAGRLPAVEAIQQRRQGDGRASRRQIGVGLALATLGLMLTAGYRIHPVEMPYNLAFGMMIAMMVGMSLLIAAAIPPLERWAGRALGVFGVEGRLGGRNLARSPGRSALTAAALMFGLASVIIIGGIVSSAKALALNYMDKTLAAHLWVYAPQRLPRSLADEIAALPEVRLARPAATIPTQFTPGDASQSELTVIFIALDPQRSQHLDFYFTSDMEQPDQAIARWTEGGAVFIASPLREWYGLDVGDTVRLQTLQGPADFEVAGVTLDLTAGGYALHGVYADAERYFGVSGADTIAVNLIPGADPKALGRRILDQWGGTYNLRFETQAEFRARTQQLTDSYFAVNDLAVLIGIVVATLGIVNTLLMNVWERRREIGMLRALGMTHGQVVRLILAEAVALGVLGGLLGVMVGAWLSGFAVETSASVNGYPLPYVFPTQAVATCVIIALCVPLLAGLWPAQRGARVNIIDAMRSE